MQNRPLNEELLRALAYYGAAGGTGGGGGGGVSAYNDLLGKPIITSQKYPSGVVINSTKSLAEYGIPQTLQEIFDLNRVQTVEFEGLTPVFVLRNTDTQEQIQYSTQNFGLKNRNDGILLKNDGTTSFNGNFLYNLVHGIEDKISSDVTVDVANWSANTTHVNGVDYYTNELSFTKIYVEHPDVVISSMNSVILPTVLEREAFTLVTSTGYFHANLTNNKITAYTQVKPTSSFKISVRGAK